MINRAFHAIAMGLFGFLMAATCGCVAAAIVLAIHFADLKSAGLAIAASLALFLFAILICGRMLDDLDGPHD